MYDRIDVLSSSMKSHTAEKSRFQMVNFFKSKTFTRKIFQKKMVIISLDVYRSITGVLSSSMKSHSRKVADSEGVYFCKVRYTFTDFFCGFVGFVCAFICASKPANASNRWNRKLERSIYFENR